MYKKGIILVAMISGVIASENPFEVENALERIEQDEGDLLNALSKEQLDVNNRSTSKKSEKQLPQEVQKIEPNIDTPKIEVKETIKKESIKENLKKPEINKSLQRDIEKPKNNKPKLLEKKETKPIKKSVKNPKVEKPKIEKKPKIIEKPKPKEKKKPKLSKEQMIKKQIEKVDDKIRDLEAKLDIAKGKVAKMPKPKLTPKEERAKAEEEAAELKRKKEMAEKEREKQIELEKIKKFEEDLKDAIFSVD